MVQLILMLYDEYFVGNYPSECAESAFIAMCYVNLAWAQINGLYKFSISDLEVKANGGKFVYFKMPLDPTINHDIRMHHISNQVLLVMRLLALIVIVKLYHFIYQAKDYVVFLKVLGILIQCLQVII